MDIAGLQKTTLLDFPGKVACTVFLAGCNLRCPFCHNAALVLPERTVTPVMTQETFMAFLATRQGKLDGVCITGGEPTLHRDLLELLRQIKALGFETKLDTNGTRPDALESLLSAGLVDYVAMDIKNSPSRYRQTCGGVEVLPQVQRSARLLMTGAGEYEFRTTVCRPFHTPEALREIGLWLRGAKRYFLQSFVDSGDLVGQDVGSLTEEELEALRTAVLPDIPNTKIRGR